MRKLIGPHLGGQWASNLDILRKWQPPLVLVLQPEVDKVSQLRDACPDAIVVGRFFHDDSHYASNINARPKEFAHEIHREILNNPVTPLLDYVQSNNETNQDWEGIQKLNVYSQEWMHLADQSQAYKCAILAFSVGNPDLPHKPGDPAGFDGRMLYWQQVLPSLNYAQQKNHILLMHAYGYPNMFAPDADWYIYRYERQVAVNLRTLGITNLKYAYGEIGIDRLIVNDKGGYKVVTNDQDYTNQLLQWEKDQQGQSLLLGGAIFTFGDSGGWDTYDIASTHVASLIAEHYVEHASEYKSPPTGTSEPMTTHLPTVSSPGTSPVEPALPPRDIDPRLIQRGVTIEEAVPDPVNGFAWKLLSLRFFNESEAQGRHHLYVERVDKNGRPIPGMTFLVKGQGSETPGVTNDKSGFDAANVPMWASEGKNGYSLIVNQGDTVKGIGMGDDTPGGFNAGAHTSTLATYQRKQVTTQPTPAPQPTPPDPAPTPTPSTPSGSNLVMPCTGVVTQRWGENPQDYARFGIPGHNGLDIANKAGTPILAIADGVVAFVGVDTDYGKYMRVFHAQFGFHSFYAHLLTNHASTGHQVKRGQKIAEMGSTGNSTGSHLHLEIRLCDQQGNYINLSGGYGKGRIDPEIIYHLLNQARVGKDDLLEIVAAAAREFDVDARLFHALVHEESKYDPEARSGAGAIGLAQIMPPTFAEWSPKVGASNIRDPRDNARVGAAYLRFLINYYHGDLRKALYAYNWGPGNVDSGRTPPPETVAYTNRILGTQPL